MPVDNTLVIVNGESVASRSPNSGINNPEVTLNFDQMNKIQFPGVIIMITAWQAHTNCHFFPKVSMIAKGRSLFEKSEEVESIK
jgi:hypothetical protein